MEAVSYRMDSGPPLVLSGAFSSAPSAISFVLSFIVPFADVVWRGLRTGGGDVPDWLRWVLAYFCLLLACLLAWRGSRRNRLRTHLAEAIKIFDRYCEEDKSGVSPLATGQIAKLAYDQRLAWDLESELKVCKELAADCGVSIPNLVSKDRVDVRHTLNDLLLRLR